MHLLTFRSSLLDMLEFSFRLYSPFTVLVETSIQFQAAPWLSMPFNTSHRKQTSKRICLCRLLQ